MLLELDIAKVAALVEPMLASPAGIVSVRDRLKEFAAAQGLPL
jgi:phosphotransferase system enzyme I (PtsP)